MGPDGSLVTYADPSGLDRGFNEMVVDGRSATVSPTASASTPKVPSGMGTSPNKRCVRVREGGEMLQTIDSTAAASPACSGALTEGRCS